MKKLLYIVLVVCLAIFFISGCSDSSDEPEPTATAILPTDAAQPTPTATLDSIPESDTTPTPDSTPTSTSTPTIIPTIEPTVTPTPAPINIGFLSSCFDWPYEEFSLTNRAVLNVAFISGDTAPNFTLKDTDGQPYSLSSLLETKPVLMVFGAFT